MRRNYLGFLMCAAGVLLVAGWHSAASKEAPAEWDGLVKRKVKGLDLVYVRPDVEFPAYKKVMLDQPVQVEFSKNWKPNSSSRSLSSHLDAEDLQRIKDGLSGMVLEGFSKKLTKGGYEVTTTPADDTIRVATAIVDLYINAPDTMSAGRSKTYTTEAGSMVLVMEIRDSPTGQLLARVVDRHSDNGTGSMQWTTSVSNRAAADRAISIVGVEIGGRTRPAERKGLLTSAAPLTSVRRARRLFGSVALAFHARGKALVESRLLLRGDGLRLCRRICLGLLPLCGRLLFCIAPLGPARHHPDRRTDCSAFPGVACDRTDRSPSSRPARGASRSCPLPGGGRILRRLDRHRRRWGHGINAGVGLRPGEASPLVGSLLCGRLIF